MSKLSSVPIVHYGEEIGVLHLAEDGTIQISLHLLTTFRTELRTAMENGEIEALSMTPIFPKTWPPQNVRIQGGSNIQIGHGNNQVNHW